VRALLFGKERIGSVFGALFTSLVFLAVFPSPAFSGTGHLPVSLERLPDSSVPCSLAGQETRLLTSLSGRPALIYVTTTAQGADNPLGYLVSGLQEEYFYWMTWAGMVVGEGTDEEVRKIHSGAPFRFEHCFLDRQGRVRSALGLKRLPALVLVNEEGFIIGRYEDVDDLARIEIVKAVDRMARSGNMAGKPVRDFRLPEIETGRLLTLLDVAGKNYTMLAFLHTGSPACLTQLQMLENVRNTYRADVSLVAIFQEETDPARIREYLEQSGVRPDFVLHDPMLRQTRSYSLGYVPVLLVAGPDGAIALSRKGYQPERSWYFSGELERFFQRRTARTAETSFTESRRIHGEALQYLGEGNPEMALMFLKRILELSPGLFTAHRLIADACRDLGRRQEAARHYGLYVAANPGAYDMPEVKAKLKVLAEASR
jgi:hypothetical protein